MTDQLLGALPEKKDPRDIIAHEFVGSSLETLPEKIGTPEGITTESQGATMRCTNEAVRNAIEKEYYNITGIKIQVDNFWDLQLKYPATGSEAKGDWVTSALKAAVHYSDPDKGHDGLDATILETGERIKVRVLNYAFVQKTPEKIREQLALGKCLVTACSTTIPDETTGWTTWTHARKEGYINLEGRYVGGHAFVCYGYDYKENKKDYGDANSFGENWGVDENGTFKAKELDVLSEEHYQFYAIYLDIMELPEKIFKDVTVDHPFADVIKKALDKGIMNGDGADTEPDPTKRMFRPNDQISRAEFCQVLENLKLLD